MKNNLIQKETEFLQFSYSDVQTKLSVK